MADAIHENEFPGGSPERDDEKMPESGQGNFNNSGQSQGGNPPAANQSAYKDPNATIVNVPNEGRPVERNQGVIRTGARGTAAMDPQTRQEVARKGGLAVSSNKQHMAEIGRKGGQSVSRNREHMANIGRKGGSASRSGRG